ncbi:MAG: hypothetical protein IJ769_07580, partial [Clostridia bacterium]|nr:hypothetical protein [Clostridia bacterium]
MDQNMGLSQEYIDDGAARLGRLAERPAPKGRARLHLTRKSVRRMEALLDVARRLQRAEGVEDEALGRLIRESRVIETCARQARAEDGAALPAWRDHPRVALIMDRLIAGGDAPLTRERLLEAVETFDALQPLTMAELWAIPQAARIALTRALLRTVAAIVSRARLCAEAARWARKNGGGPIREDPAFIEYALKRVSEDGLPEARARLDAHLSRRGLAAESVVPQAQAERARDALRLENLLAARRMLDGMNWQTCFQGLSQVDRALRGVDAGMYERMDEASRAAVRRQVAAIARRLRLPEIVVARYAVDAARRGEGIRADACWWLYDDEGREALLERMGRGKVRLRKMTPDPAGRWVVAAQIALAALLTLFFSGLTDNLWLLAPCAVLGWSCAGALIGRFYPKLFPPARLLKLELEEIPSDCRTLVVMPVLLSTPERAEGICDQLEALGCLEKDKNIEYLLLGDFADAPRQDMPGDGAILERAREKIAGMNARAGWEKYALLHRRRMPLAADGLWMGRDRKRGALMDLNRLLVGEAGAEAAFRAEGAACERLRGRFRYVLTLDADTRLLPGEVRRLIGAMAHPLNRPDGTRGYVVLQPRMEPLPSACVNGFVRLFAGPGGVNAYPVSVSNLWQDLTGRGIYAGKGIYDVKAFYCRLNGALPEGRVLSHDLIEGAIAGAGFIGDVAFYDGYPTSLSAFVRRLHRWTRGDWQLLPFMLSKKLPNGKALAGADRFRMLDNLLRSLRAPALLALLTGAVWTGGGGTLLAALIVNYLEPLLNPRAREGRLWRRATAELAILPALAWCSLDAIVVTLWRLGVSGRHLMQWVTAADAEARRGVDRRVV